MAPRLRGGRGAGYREGHLRLGTRSISCAIGRAGVVHKKREGDGGTPAGTFTLLSGFFRTDREVRPSSRIKLLPVHRELGWCDEPGANQYNRPVRIPFRYSHEQLWRSDRLYDFVLVMDYNIQPRRKYAGSAIFFHIAENNLGPTAGCIAVRLAEMRRILPQLSAHCRMVIV